MIGSVVQRWAGAVLVLAMAGVLAGCVADSGSEVRLGDAPASDSASSPAPHDDGRIWFEVIGVSRSARGIGELAVATDTATLATVWQDHRFDDPVPEVSFEEHIVLIAARPQGGCVDELIAMRLREAVLEPRWMQSVLACSMPLIPTAFAVALHRGALPSSFTAVLREDEVYDADAELVVSLPTYDGPSAPPPPPLPHRMTDEEVDAVFAGHALRRCEAMPTFTTAPVVDGPLSSDPELAGFQESRAAYGLPSDRRTVRALAADPSAETAFGFPMTAAEFEEVMARNRMQFNEDFHGSYVPEHAADTWGFMLLDQAAGGQFVIGFTSDLDAHRRRLADRYPDVAMRLVQAPASAQRLEALQRSVQPLLSVDRAPRVVHTGTAVYLRVGVLDPTREDLDLIADHADAELTCVEVIRSGPVAA